jgi:hypothetical protein
MLPFQIMSIADDRSGRDADRHRLAAKLADQTCRRHADDDHIIA